MRSLPTLSLLALSFGYLSLSTTAAAGTLSATLTLDGAYSATYTTGNPYPVGHIARGVAVANGSSTLSGQGAAKINLTYVGTATDTSPSSITWSYSATTTGHVGHAFLGRTPPSGGGSSNYAINVVPDVGSPQTLYDQIGPVYQQTTYTSSSNDKTLTTSPSDVSVPVSSWSQTVSGTTVTYTRQITVFVFQGSVGADCNVAWKGSNTNANFNHTFDTSTFEYGY